MFSVLPDMPWLEAIDFVVWEDRFEMDRLRRRVDIMPRQLDDAEMADLVSFMGALTGRTAQSLSLGISERVPSGLPVDE